MWKQSVWSSAISAKLAAIHLKQDGCVVLPGAAAAEEGTPGMIGYGMAKAAVHQLVKSLAAEKSGLPEGAFVTAILPVTLVRYVSNLVFYKANTEDIFQDTPMNRKWMPKADHSAWTSLEFVSDLLYKWCCNEERPANGSLVKLTTKNGNTEINCVK